MVPRGEQPAPIPRSRCALIETNASEASPPRPIPLQWNDAAGSITVPHTHAFGCKLGRMGLTLHYELRAPASWPAPKIDAVLTALRQAALTKPFDEVSEFVVAERADDDTASPWSSTLRFFADILATPFEDDPPDLEADPNTARGFFVNPGEQCETASFAFLERRDAAGARADWFWRCHCKTQYASIVSDEHFVACHTNLVAMLDFAQSLGVDLHVEDETNYWESRDMEQLATEARAMNRLMARVAGALSDALEVNGDSDAPRRVEAPIFEHPRFERLEMGEDG